MSASGCARGSAFVVVISVLMALVCGCDETAETDNCVTETACAGDEDCVSGSRCNLSLNPPMCQKLYCGPTGSSCSDAVFCKGESCSGGICVCSPDCTGRECGLDPVCGLDCGTCGDGLTCESGVCMPGQCNPDCTGRECGLDPVCGSSCGTCGYGLACSSGLCTQVTADIDMVSIPAGTFQMGSENGFSYEKPLHSVTVKSFEMSRTEVTVRQYKECVDAGSCTEPDTGRDCTWDVSGKEEHPVNCVDWNQATSYAAWVGGRLPTEAEWEYAARAGTTGDRYGKLDDIAWYDGNSDHETQAVGQLTPNAYGLYDMLGNVREWCQDWYHDSYNGAPGDGSAWESPSGSDRVDRGGSWFYGADNVRVALRSYYDPGNRSPYLGIRVSRSVP